jgi:type 2 lantibiotic biosynthesis protein LanM
LYMSMIELTERKALISQQDLIKIVEKASIFSERLGKEFVFNESQTDRDLMSSRLEKWCQVAAKGDRQKFERRLAWQGLDIEMARRALGRVSLVNKGDLPSWVETLREGMQASISIFSEISDRERPSRQYLDSEKPLPFEEILLSFVDVAKKKLRDRVGSKYQLLSTVACTQLERSLLQQLTGLCASPLELEFSIFRSFHGFSPIPWSGQLPENSSRKKYVEFVKKILQDGMLSFFQEYSVLARLVATATDFWLDATSEFLLRLASDWEKIQIAFGKNQELEQVVAVRATLSDPHNCGHSVIGIEFASGLKLVYKPKNLGLEQTYFDFLAWINQQGVALPFKLLKVINCSTHGWMEFVEALPCENQQAVRRYYQRAGMLLCLVYALRGTDCHCENLIACGEQPVLVDLETLLHHRTWANEDDADARSLANERLQDSVVGTALLPGWQLVPYALIEGMRQNLSGLGDSSGQEIPYYALKWKHINTDTMAIAREDTKMPPKQNQPFGEGINTSLSNYSEELIDGFRQMYQFLMQRQETLLAPNSPITAFSRQKVRLVLRNTSIYFSVLQKSLDAKYLRDGVERSIELDILSRTFLGAKSKRRFWALVAAETRALEQLDIPYFSAYSDSNAIVINAEEAIDKFLDRPSYDDVISRLQQLDDADLAEQISIIRGSLYSCLADEKLNILSHSAEPYLNSIASFSQAEILDRAIAIATQIQQRAIYGANGSTAWIGMGYVPPAKQFQLQPLSYGLYDGCCGVSLFLAALTKVTGRSEFGDLALRSLKTLRTMMQDSETGLRQKLFEEIGIGGAKGVASIVYAFVRIAEFLGETQLIVEAQQAASCLMVVDEASGDLAPGIADGTCAIILSLLALYKATKEPTTLARATSWGKHLLDTRVTAEGGYKAWTTLQGKTLTGFSRGAAGIAYTLLQLYAATQNVVFRSAAKEAIACEPNCQSLDTPNNTLSINGWCDEISGLVMARLGGLAILETDEIHQEVEIALQTRQNSNLQALDSLSCGNFGCIEALLVAAQQLGQSKLQAIAHKQIERVLTRADRTGAFVLLPNLPVEVYNPSFCQGMSGIGYELLRAIYPDLLPSILLWQ